MDELSLNILDIAYNSIRANASHIMICIKDSVKQNVIEICIQDDGCGMSHEEIQKVIDPFYTTRTTRKVGLGIPLFKQNAELTGGYLKIVSQKDKGTRVETVFIKNHIDTPIMGDLVETMITLILANDKIDYKFQYITDEKEFCMNTQEIKEILGDVSITTPEVIIWLKDYIKEGLDQ